jgi:tRNA(Ile2) C34 agmatinyltransferase TiaS
VIVLGFKINREVIRIDTINGKIQSKKEIVKRDAVCKKCGTDTRSHMYDDGTFMCHRCWLIEEEKKKKSEPRGDANGQDAGQGDG